MPKKRTEDKVSVQKLSSTYAIAEANEDFHHITAIVDCGGNITLQPHGGQDGTIFIFKHSDPDEVIAVANLMVHAAGLAKKEKF